jgi:glycosyltransferase involved in cell wall biosynthesis
MGVEVMVIDPWPSERFRENLSAIWRGDTAIRRLDASGVTSAHVNLASNGSAWRKAALTARLRSCGIPYVLHLHGGRFDHFFGQLRAPQKAIIRSLFHGARSTVVLGAYWHDFVSEQIGLPDSLISVVPNGVLGPDLPRPSGPEPELRILFSGRVSEGKGSADLVRAAAEALADGVPLEVRLAGDGDVGRVEALAASLGISGSVTTLGWVSPEVVTDLLCWANVFCLPSYAEGLPMSVLEAMANQVCVVATRVGSVPDVLKDGRNGVLLEPGDTAALRDALERLSTHPGSRNRLAAAGRRTWESRYSSRRMAEAILRIHGATGG